MNNVYLYRYYHAVLFKDNVFCTLKDNGPMHRRKILIHKGVDNDVHFRALGPDNRPVKIASDELIYVRLVDPASRKLVLEKLCQIAVTTVGIFHVTLNSGDLASLDPGILELSLIRTEPFVANQVGTYIEKPIYTDYVGNMVMEVEITEQAMKNPAPAVTISPVDWFPAIAVINGERVNAYYSSSIPAGRVLNHKEAVHSFSTYTHNFTGVLEIWGTLEESPSAQLDEQRWFKIYPSTMSVDIEYTGFTGTQAWTFAANFMWLKFRYIPSTQVSDPGEMKKIIVRV